MPEEKIKVLLVEDNPGDVRLVEEMIKTAGAGQFELSVEGTLDGALSKIQSSPFTAVLLDLNLPDSRGIATLKRLHDNALGIPIVVMTGLGDETVAVESLKAGAEDFLVKGKADGSSLVRALRYAIGRQQVAEKLKESEEKYRVLVENADQLILVAQDGKVGFVNNHSFDLLGYQPDELTGKPFINYIYPEDQKLVGERYAQRLRGESPPNNYAFRLIARDGQLKWVQISAVRIDWQGKPATLNFLTDITTRKQAEIELEKNVKELEKITKIMEEREDRIVELKNEVKELKQRLGEK